MVDGQSAVFSGLFLKAVIIAVGAATGLLGILVAFAFGAALIRLIGKAFSKVGGALKRKPKENVVKPAEGGAA